jgi:sugar lactone lactonase YvrE
MKWLALAAMLLGLTASGEEQKVLDAPHADAASHAVHPETASSAGNITSVSAGYLLNPTSVAVDASGNVYVADQLNDRVQKVSADGTTVTTVAGQIGNPGFGGDGGPATSAQLNQPTGLALDVGGNLYIADRANNRIREVNATSQVITTIAGDGTAGFSGDTGQAVSAELSGPTGVAVDTHGNLFIADQGNAVVREVAAGVITTVAGMAGFSGYSGDGGPATSAELGGPFDVAVDSSGNLYISDPYSPSVRKVAGGMISTVAGDGFHPTYAGDGGEAVNATLYPFGLTVDSAGNLYIACGGDSNNNRITKISNGVITTVAGDGTLGQSGVPGSATLAELSDPEGVALDSSKNVYIADTGNNAIEKVTFAGTSTPTVTVTPATFTVTTAQSLTVTIAVSGGNGTAVATGTVTLTGGGYTSPATTLSDGAATITIAAGELAVGSYDLTVNYTPDSASSSVYSPATGESPTVSVSGAVPTIAIATSAASISSAQPLTVSISVTGVTGSPTPTGSVILTSGSYTSATTVLTAGLATIVIPGGSLAAATDTLTVVYTPDAASSAIYATATGTVMQVVTSASNVTPTVTVTPSAASITTAQPLTVTVVVSKASGKPAPTGMVTLTSGSYGPVSATLTGGSASFSLSPGVLPLGTDTLSASYAPDTSSSSVYNSSSGTAQVMVVAPAKIAPMVQVTPSATSITTAQALSVSIQVLGGSGNPGVTGAVTLTGGGYTSAMIPLENELATIVIPYGMLAPGNDTLIVTYTPDANSASIYSNATGKTMVTVTTIARSTPAVTITPNPPSINTAESTLVTVALAGTPAPTGTVVLSSGSYISSPATLHVGSTTFTIPAGTLPAGTDTLTAAYTPDTTGAEVYNPSTGTATITVAPAGAFTVSNSASSLTISPGATSGNTATISITPVSGFSGQINLACAVTTSLSTYTDLVTCTLGSGGTTKTSVMLNGAPVTTTLTVQSTAPGSTTSSARTLSPLFFGSGAVLAGVLFFGIRPRGRAWQTLLGVCLLATFGLALGCSNSFSSSSKSTPNPGTTAGPYLVTVTGTDAATGTLTSTNTINVIVN